MALFGLLRRPAHERTGFELYGAAVAAARDPALFETFGVPDTLAFGVPGTPAFGVPDTLEGRFEAIALHVAVLVRRLRRDPDPRGAALAQAVFDAMFADMDTNLREMGVGDMSIGKRVKRMWEAWHGRARALEAALDQDDDDALTEALARNVWIGVPPEGAPAALAARVRAMQASLDAQPVAALAAGRAEFGAGEAGR